MWQMDDLYPVALVCLGRYYLLDLLGPFSQRWYLLGPPPECGAPRSYDATAFPDMVLLSESLHGRGESLNLSLEGSCVWFISLNVVSGCH